MSGCDKSGWFGGDSDGSQGGRKQCGKLDEWTEPFLSEREKYYGRLPWKPQTTATGQYSFEDGEITYCVQNNTIAIFYAQTSRPNLTMEVVPMGKVTSNLSVFSTLPSRAEFTFE